MECIVESLFGSHFTTDKNQISSARPTLSVSGRNKFLNIQNHTTNLRLTYTQLSWNPRRWTPAGPDFSQQGSDNKFSSAVSIQKRLISSSIAIGNTVLWLTTNRGKTNSMIWTIVYFSLQLFRSNQSLPVQITKIRSQPTN